MLKLFGYICVACEESTEAYKGHCVLCTSTEAYKGHCVLCKSVLSFVFQTFDFQVLCFCFGVLCLVLLVELVAQPRC